MPDAFFANKKRKRSTQGAGPSRKIAKTKKSKGDTVLTRTRKAPKATDEELASNATNSDIDDLELQASEVDPNESDREDYAHETPAEKRLRLAKIYLDSLKEELATGEGDYDAAEIDREIISARLKEDVLENAGKVYMYIADSLALDGPAPSRLRVKPHRLPVTAAVVSDDAKRLYTSGKEGGMACCDLATGKRLHYAPKLRSDRPVTSKGKGKGKAKAVFSDVEGHTDEVLTLALSGDGKYLVTGGKDRRVCVWSIAEDVGDDDIPKCFTWVKAFSGHKDTIVRLSFRKSTNSLYSASADRTIRIFDLSSGVMGYVETLFGHQEAITDLDSLKGDSAISTGGRDRTVRFWKVADETQLVFRGGGAAKSKVRQILEGGIEEEQEEQIQNAKKRKDMETWVEGSMDCVAMIDEYTFLSGGDSGSICLWNTGKKKPIFTFTVAHGLEEIESTTEGTLQRPRWIISLACLRYGDIFASGSWDGHVRLWKLDSSLRSFSKLGSLDVRGIINSLQVIPIPRGWEADKTWVKAVATSSKPYSNGHVNNEDSAPTQSNGVSIQSASTGWEGVLVVAAVGQEPRLGRWVKLKGDGVVNSAIVFSLRRRAVPTK